MAIPPRLRPPNKTLPTTTLLIAVYQVLPWIFRALPPRLSVIESGSGFFAIRSDLINIGLFIGNRVFWPLSDRNRFSSRYATLIYMHAASGLFSWRWSSWHLQVACLLDHLLTTSACHSNPFFLVSERARSA